MFGRGGDVISVRFSGVDAEVRELREQLDAAIADVLSACDFILGGAVTSFEQAFASLCGTAHAIGCANGLDALTLLLQAAGVGPGDEVITQANSFIATAYSIARAGATPVLVDCRPADMSLDVDQVEAVIGPRTRAIVGVHLYGRLLDTGPLRDIAARHGLRLFEDAAQAHGAIPGSMAGATRASRAGSLSDGASFSFYPAKNLGAAGDGGIVTTSDPDLAARVRLAINYGQRERYVHDAVHGTNSRLDTIQAAILAVKLPHLDQWNAARREAAGWYCSRLSGTSLTVPPPPAAPESHVWHLYPVRVPDPARRDAIRTQLAAAGIETGIHYPRPIHLQNAFAHLRRPIGSYPVAEDAAGRIISLPMHAFLDRRQVDHVCDTLLEAVGS
jgi:dTDP-4-amino-4,6-dideoxygalactose transaminase